MGQPKNKKTRSVGVLRSSKIKTRPLSPDLSGNLHLQRHTLERLAEEVLMTDQEEVICNIKAWIYSDEGGHYLNVELSALCKGT
jgi:hypothetical protein